MGGVKLCHVTQRSFVMSKNIKNKPSFNPWDEKSDPHKSRISLSDVSSFLSNLEGKLLTIIDASYFNEKQNQAIKSLIRNNIWSEYDIVHKWYYEQDDNGATPFPYGQRLL